MRRWVKAAMQLSQSPMGMPVRGGDHGSLSCSSPAKLFNIAHLSKTLTAK
jgi:hypothetical protein